MKKLLALALSMMWPVAAHACSVCYAANDRNRIAFFNTTILLSLLPLGMIAGGALWFVKNARLRLDEEFRDRDASVAPLPDRATQS
ncbi:MAG: hypothetical protein ACRENS_09495 [Candidatus Eiseniibacteriota bacterium]